MTCPVGDLDWQLRYGSESSKLACALTAASVIDSFNYLIMNCNKEEAWRRIKIMRSAMLKRCEERE